ncbi:MAG TPA: thioredoxin-dependent thiol peroxidase [Egibacteraceae bacterium]|nr:thioredoxin-dependent thiol peroxidase [Egibacteraceae bacterium]
MGLKPGDTAPDFTLLDQDGTPWTLAEQRGRPVVLYFYPKDDTPGCTTQGCDIRDHWSRFEAAGVVVAGVSPDSAESHAKFAGKYGFPHTLLADTARTVIQSYGAWGERSMYGKKYMGVVRSSVVIDAAGKVAAVFSPIKPADQSKKALEALAAL